jgi:hypothetical protein
MGFMVGGGGNESLFSMSDLGSAKNLVWSKGRADCADGESGMYVGVLGDRTPFSDSKLTYEVSSLAPETQALSVEEIIVAVGRGNTARKCGCLGLRSQRHFRLGHLGYSSSFLFVTMQTMDSEIGTGGGTREVRALR